MTPIVDVFFGVRGSRVSADHGYALYGAVARVLEYKTDSQWPNGVQWGDPQPYTEEKRQSFLSELRAGLRKLGL
jgi:hypothetical protein